MNKTLAILGAPDPEMHAIEDLLVTAGVQVAHAMADGRRVHPGNAYRADSRGGSYTPWRENPTELHTNLQNTVIWVECGPADGSALETAFAGIKCISIDHHRPGDHGYGMPPANYWEASSIGQTAGLLGVNATHHLLMVAAADHCLAAAYRGECPGVDPDELMRWRAESRAEFQRRPVADVMADVNAARRALRDAPDILLAGHFEHYDFSELTVVATAAQHAKDMRGRHVPELPEAAAREGVCFVADLSPGPDGRRKTVCQAGSPDQITAFKQWADREGLVDIYGDPARGFAGGYAEL